MATVEHEWQRTDPDFQLFIPNGTSGPTATNQHVMVVPTPSDDFVAVWTQASTENEPDQRVVVARSVDSGKSWSAPEVLDGPTSDDDRGTGLASYPFTVVAPDVGPDGGHRIYCFYNKNVGVDDGREDTTGVLRCQFSDDDGRTWSVGALNCSIEPCAISHPDADVPENWIVYQQPTVTQTGAVLVGFTHWASTDVDEPASGSLFDRHSEIRFLRFPNLLEATDPTTIRATTWPDAPHGLQVPHPDRPGISVAQEPSVRKLADGRLICVMRTRQGTVHFAVSEDDGRSWDTPRPLHYQPTTPSPIENPLSPCPLYRLNDGRYLLVFYNNDGTGHGASGPADFRANRTPAWYAVGVETDHRTHPLRFEGPWVLADNDRIPWGPTDRTEVATYPSFFQHNGRAYLWYPDRKHFLLGKELTHELADRP